MSDLTSGTAGKPRALYTYDAHRSAIVLECLSAFVFFMSLMAPRGMLMWLALWVMAAFAQRLIHGDVQRAKDEAFQSLSPGAKQLSLVVVALVGWAGLSAMWSPVPAITIDKSLKVAGLVLVLGVGVIFVSSMDQTARWHAARGAIHGFLAGALFGRLFVKFPALHFAERSLALHLLLQRAQGLLDIIVADDDLYQGSALLLKQKRHGRRSRDARK